MKRNDIVVCKKNLPNFTMNTLKFIVNEKYKIVEIKQGMIILVNINDGEQGTINPNYFDNYFMTLKEERKLKIQKINEKESNMGDYFT